MSALLPTTDITVDGVTVRYHQSGSGPDVVLLHGFPETLNCWYAVAPDLARDHRVHAFDWPGLGPGSVEFPDPSPASFTQFLLDALDALSIEQPVLVGTDIAMLPVLLATLERPTVAGAVVMDGRCFPGSKYLSWELRAIPLPVIGYAFAHASPRITQALSFKRGFAGASPVPADVHADFASWAHNRSQQRTGLRYFRNFDPSLQEFQQNVSRFNAPLRAVWGANDVFISNRMGQDLISAVPGSSITVIHDAGHYAHMERPTHVAASIREFAASLSSRAAGLKD